ncbi:MAG: hypothetical protein IPH86_19455 [bacterium]|nr:hypothetical protein [bacterium]
MIEESVKNADNGVAITREVGAVLAEISTAAGEVFELVSGIARASATSRPRAMPRSTRPWARWTITQANAANAEETASASEELSGRRGDVLMVRELESMAAGTLHTACCWKIPAMPMRRTYQRRRP